MKKLLLFTQNLIVLFLFLFFCSPANGQIKMLVTYNEMHGYYYDNYGTFDKFKFFHNQSLINFTHSEEKALISFYSNTSKKNYDKYVLTNRERRVVYTGEYVKSGKPKIDTTIGNL